MSASRSAASPAAILVETVTVSYRTGVTALEDVSLRLDRPTICGLVGMNGAGKSTLFKTIMGFVSPTRGRVSVDGGPVAAAQKAGTIAYVPQAEEVDWTFPVSVADVVMMGRQGRMGFLRIPSREDRRIVAESLERVGMAGFADRQIGELSGGQRKRVFLARALAQRGRILLLDEPFTGVDAKTEAAMLEILKGLEAEGQIILIATHDLAAVPTFCDTVAMINRRLVAFGPVGEVYTADNLARTFGGTLPHLALAAGPAGRAGIGGPLPIAIAARPAP